MGQPLGVGAGAGRSPTPTAEHLDATTDEGTWAASRPGADGGVEAMTDVPDGDDVGFDTPDQVRRRDETLGLLGSVQHVRDVRYAIIDGYRPLRMDLVVPTGLRGATPVVLSIHGGGWRSGSPKPENGDGRRLVEVWRALLDRGVAVASVEYRQSDEAPFPAALHDVKAAVRWLRAHGVELGLSGDRIAAFGDSAGGHLSALLATGTDTEDLEGTVGVVGVSSRISAAAAWYAPSRLDVLYASGPRASPDSFGSQLIGGSVAENLPAARAASPFEHVCAMSAPLLLQHGTEDSLVPVEQSIDLAARYRGFGVPVELDVIPGEEHGFEGDALEFAVKRTAAFLTQHLGEG